jgi:hypothetical protein
MTGSWPRPVRSLGTWATPTSGSSIFSLLSCRTQTLCPPRSSGGLSLRGRLVLASVTSSLRKGGAAGEATHRRPAAVPSEPCQRGRCSPRTSLPVTRSADDRRQLRRSVLGPYRIGNLRIWTGASGHDAYDEVPGRNTSRSWPRSPEQRGGGFESHLSLPRAGGPCQRGGPRPRGASWPSKHPRRTRDA